MNLRDPFVFNWLMGNKPPANQSMSMPMPNPGLMHAMPQQAQMPEEKVNPISNGTVSAIKSARESMRLSDTDKSNAFGAALMRFGSGLLAGDSPSYWNNVGNAMNPAVETYLAEQNRAEEINHKLMQEAEKKERYERDEMQRLKEREEDLAFKREALNQRNNKSDVDERRQLQIEKMREAGLIGEDEEPVSGMGVYQRRDSAKDVRDRVDAASAVPYAIDDLKEIKKIANEYPNLSEDFINVFNLDPSERPTAFEQLLLRNTDRGKRTAIQKMAKLNSDLVFRQVKALKGSQSTDVMKEILKKTTPDKGNTKEAIDFVADRSIKVLSNIYDDGVSARKAWSKGVYRMKKIPDLEEEMEEQPMMENTPQMLSGSSSIQDIVERHRAQYPHHAHIPDEEIIDYYRKHPEQ